MVMRVQIMIGSHLRHRRNQTKNMANCRAREHHSMNKRFFSHSVAVVLFATATSAHATVHRVYPGESIQGAIDVAAPGDTILVEPGTYQEVDNGRYGLRISTDNLRLIGKSKNGEGVRLIQNESQETGVYAAPEGCDYDVGDDSELGQECRSREVQDFYVRGFSVEEFPKNGIQTRWVDGFEFVRNASVNNLNNGIYPTLSANGLVRDNASYGSLDTAMWIAGSENVRVIGNELHGSVIGFEITVSHNVEVKQNEIYNNAVGVGLFHPGGAGNPPLPEMKNWDISHNNIYDNNRPNDAPPGSFQSELPTGIGVLMLGVSDHVVSKNTVSGNEFLGVGMLGWCTANALTGAPERCNDVVLGPLSLHNNLISLNKLSNNGTNPPAGNPLSEAAADIVYIQGPPFEDAGVGNCFEKNKPSDFTFTSLPDGALGPVADELPSDGC
jgi:parallel beta-helix repeat protein